MSDELFPPRKEKQAHPTDSVNEVLDTMAQVGWDLRSVMADQDDISRAIQGIRSRLDTLASINEANIFIPGGPQSRYHAIVEEAYAALGLVETQIDELQAELEYQHKRLDEIRDARLSQEEEYQDTRKYIEHFYTGGE